MKRAGGGKGLSGQGAHIEKKFLTLFMAHRGYLSKRNTIGVQLYPIKC
jgi:hypothetical protein